MDSKWISCLSLLYFFSLSFLSLSLSCQYSSFLTQEKRRRSFSCVCVLSENKKPFFFIYDFTRCYITQIFEFFCQGQIACNGQLYFQLLWDAYSGTCDALSLLFSQGVPCSSVPTSKLYMSTYTGRSNWQLKFTWIRFCKAPREHPKAMAEHNCPFFLPQRSSKLSTSTTTVQNECELKSAPICSPRRQFGAKLCEYVPLSFTHDRYIRHTATDMIILMTDISVIWHSTG